MNRSVSAAGGRSKTGARDPGRTRERILAAALKEFSDNGFAGARVDVIARRAAINKRMIYHYFGNKEELFRAVLRRKIAERQAWGEATPEEPSKSLPLWFDLACQDADWIRLLEWEALRGGEKPVLDEAERRAVAQGAVERIRRRQTSGHLSSEFDPRHVLLAMIGLTTYPVAFPQLTRLITGRQVSDAQFQKERRDFLRKFAVALSPSKAKTE
ncbi:MAG TPA: TetR family transcriptional regulator [Candidatus Angelobacter sp.]|nr:TetR family transcriptional regulator [Candidatus Angelobacter sp.]